MNRISQRELVHRLIADGHLTEGQSDDALHALKARAGDTPWFVMAMQIGGGWLACLLVVVGVLLLTGGDGDLVIGLFALCVGLVMSRQSQDSLFHQQLVLGSCLIGVALTIFGIARTSNVEAMPEASAVFISIVAMVFARPPIIKSAFVTVGIIGLATLSMRFDAPFFLWSVFLGALAAATVAAEVRST